MSQPTLVTVNQVCPAGRHLDREKLLRPLRLIDLVKPRRLRSARVNLWTTLDERPRQQSRVRIQRGNRPTQRKLRNRACGPAVQVRCEHRSGTGIKSLPTLRTNDLAAVAALCRQA